MFFIIFAGMPPTIRSGGMSFVATASVAKIGWQNGYVSTYLYTATYIYELGYIKMASKAYEPENQLFEKHKKTRLFKPKTVQKSSKSHISVYPVFVKISQLPKISQFFSQRPNRFLYFI